jgi:hypothetical protein
MRRGPAVQQADVQILTPTLQLAGRFEFFGPLLFYLNDADRDGVVIQNARIAALDPSAPLRMLNRPSVTIRRSEIALLHLADPEILAKASLLKREERLVAYTPLAILQGDFHMLVESQLEDFLSTTTGQFLPLTDAQVFPLVSLPMSFPERCDLLMVSRRFIQIYHPR